MYARGGGRDVRCVYVHLCLSRVWSRGFVDRERDACVARGGKKLPLSTYPIPGLHTPVPCPGFLSISLLISLLSCRGLFKEVSITRMCCISFSLSLALFRRKRHGTFYAGAIRTDVATSLCKERASLWLWSYSPNIRRVFVFFSCLLLCEVVVSGTGLLSFAGHSAPRPQASEHPHAQGKRRRRPRPLVMRRRKNKFFLFFCPSSLLPLFFSSIQLKVPEVWARRNRRTFSYATPQHHTPV